MKLFGKHSQGTHLDTATKREETDIEKGNVELVESVNEELDDDNESEQVFTCSDCNVTLPLSTVKKNLYVCPECGKHAKISARRRMAGLADPGTFRKIKFSIPFNNPLDYPDYEEKISGLKTKTGLDEGVLVAADPLDIGRHPSVASKAIDRVARFDGAVVFHKI